MARPTKQSASTRVGVRETPNVGQFNVVARSGGNPAAGHTANALASALNLGGQLAGQHFERVGQRDEQAGAAAVTRGDVTSANIADFADRPARYLKAANKTLRTREAKDFSQGLFEQYQSEFPKESTAAELNEWWTKQVTDSFGGIGDEDANLMGPILDQQRDNLVAIHTRLQVDNTLARVEESAAANALDSFQDPTGTDYPALRDDLVAQFGVRRANEMLAEGIIGALNKSNDPTLVSRIPDELRSNPQFAAGIEKAVADADAASRAIGDEAMVRAREAAETHVNQGTYTAAQADEDVANGVFDAGTAGAKLATSRKNSAKVVADIHVARTIARRVSAIEHVTAGTYTERQAEQDVLDKVVTQAEAGNKVAQSNANAAAFAEKAQGAYQVEEKARLLERAANGLLNPVETKQAVTDGIFTVAEAASLRFQSETERAKQDVAFEARAAEEASIREDVLRRASDKQAVANGVWTEDQASQGVAEGRYTTDQAGDLLNQAWENAEKKIGLETYTEHAMAGNMHLIPDAHRQQALAAAAARYPGNQEEMAFRLGIRGGVMWKPHKDQIEHANLSNPEKFQEAFAVYQTYRTADPQFIGSQVSSSQQLLFDTYHVLTGEGGIDADQASTMILNGNPEAARGMFADRDARDVMDDALKDLRDIPWSFREIKDTPLIQSAFRTITTAMLASGGMTVEQAAVAAVENLARNRVVVDQHAFHANQGWPADVKGFTKWIKAEMVPEGEDPDDFTVSPDFETRNTNDVNLVRNGSLPFGAGLLRFNVREEADRYDAHVRGIARDDAIKGAAREAATIRLKAARRIGLTAPPVAGQAPGSHLPTEAEIDAEVDRMSHERATRQEGTDEREADRAHRRARITTMPM